MALVANTRGVTGVVPKLGGAIRLLRTTAVQHGVLWVAFGGLLVLGLSLIWGSSDEDEHTPGGPDAPGQPSADVTFGVVHADTSMTEQEVA